MASRKTYFGIGWPKDPTDPAAKVENADDKTDEGPSGEHSAPTVVDDEKVAEGLAQLRSWYQSDAPGSSRPAATSMPAAPSPEPPGTRPTAVGHASSQQQMLPRPLAPDPMRATMYGHDIHRFEFDAPAAAPEVPSPPSSPSVADRGAAGRSAGATDLPPRQPEPTPRAPEWDAGGGQPDPFRLADYLRRQAAQPQQGAARWVASRDTAPVRTTRGLPLLVFAIGFAALAVAILLSLLSRDNSGSGAGSGAPAAAPAPTMTGSALDRPPAPVAPTQQRARDVTSPRTVEKLGAKPADSERQVVKRRRAPAQAVTESRADDESDSAPTETQPPDDGASTAPAAPAEAERPVARARPSEPARPKSTDRKRVKSAPLRDADSTLPPSIDN